LQEAVAGVSGEEIVFAVKETNNKRLFGMKSERSSKEGKVGIQKSYGEPDMEIEFEEHDSGDNINDGDAE